MAFHSRSPAESTTLRLDGVLATSRARTRFHSAESRSCLDRWSAEGGASIVSYSTPSMESWREIMRPRDTSSADTSSRNPKEDCDPPSCCLSSVQSSKGHPLPTNLSASAYTCRQETLLAQVAEAKSTNDPRDTDFLTMACAILARIEAALPANLVAQCDSSRTSAELEHRLRRSF